MSDHKRVFLLILIMTAVAGSIGIAAVGLLYHAAFEEERQRLIEIAKSQARLIESIARFDKIYSTNYPMGTRKATLSQIHDAHAVYEGFGKTGEFTLAEREGQYINFILSFRHEEPDSPKRIPIQSHLAEPMRRALAGRSGNLIGFDYRNVKVLAAHEPIAMLNLGIVAKIDLVEIRAPFMKAGSIVVATALLLIAGGIFLFFRVSKPILQSIADSEERFRSISTAAQDAIIMINDRDQIEYWNPAAERIFDYSQAEAIGKALHEWLAPVRFHVDFKSAFPHFAASGQGAFIGKTRELEAQRKGGETFPIELSISSLLLKGRWYAIGVVRDITERKHTERLLHETEECWRLLLDSTGEGIYGVDLNDRCTFVNPACVKILGYKNPENLLGRDIHKLIHHTRPDGNPYPAEECPIYKSYRCGIKIHVDNELFWRNDGSCFPVEYRAQPMQRGQDIVGCVVTFSDITERKRAEEALRRERDFAESLIETAQVIVLVLDTEGRIMRYNRFTEELSGYRLEEVRGKDWFNIFMPEQEREQIRHVFQKTVSDIQTIGQVNPLVTRNGQQRLVAWYDKTLKDAAGQVIGVLTIGHDITEKKKQEEQLLQAQKMEVVGQLTGGIAHDFNNLLTVILGGLDALTTEIEKETAPEVFELTQDALSAARDAEELTKRLLALSRRQALKPHYIGLDKVVVKLQKFLRRILVGKYPLHINPAKEALTVFVDTNQLENALLNLVINARDAMPSGGTLTIDIFRKKILATDVASSDSDILPGSYAVMMITDTGIGMSQETLSHAIEPFFTTKKSGKGTGLGLSMVYNFVKQSGGSLRLNSTPGTGTSVSLLLPEVEARNEIDKREKKLDSIASGSETILVVEDEPRIRKLVVHRLRNFGYRVYESENVQSAKEIIESHTDIDLVFSDIVMPGEFDGYDLVSWAQVVRPELKVLLTTGATSESSENFRHVSVLRKPFSDNKLQETIRAILDI